MAKTVFKYSNGEVKIVWQPELLNVSADCLKFFKAKEKPWITPEGSTTEKMIQQVKKMPEWGVSYFINNDEPAKE